MVMVNTYRGTIDMLQKVTAKVLLSIGAIVVSNPVLANHALGSSQTNVDYAVVDHVKTLTRIVNVPAAREECWEEPVTRYQPPTYSYTPTIVGGIIGAVVGNQFGRGSGRDWATVAGTTLGASLGHDYGNRRAYAAGRSYTTIEQRCRIVSDYRQEEQADGYLVTYSYNGRQYKSRVAHHPGERIKVRVDITPAQN